jgi:acyl carrier protein
VADAGQLAAVLAEARRAMPPLRGVVHAAMVLDDAFLPQLTADRFAAVLGPKAVGAWNLHELTADDPLDFFVLFSSFAAVLGSPGQANYAAGNAFLDALAHHRRALGRPAVAVNWGVVADVGYVADRPGLSQNLIERLGAKPLTARVLLDTLGELLRRGAVQAAVGQINWRQLATVNRIGEAPLLAHLVGAAGPGGDGGGHSRRDAILTAPAAERTGLLQDYVLEQVARVLGTSPGQVDAERPLTTVGLDSLMAFELKNRLEGELRVEVSPMKLMEGVSAAGLAALLNGQLPAGAGAAPAAAPAAPPASTNGHAGPAREEILAELNQLSDAEVDALLRAELSDEAGRP